MTAWLILWRWELGCWQCEQKRDKYDEQVDFKHINYWGSIIVECIGHIGILSGLNDFEDNFFILCSIGYLEEFIYVKYI